MINKNKRPKAYKGDAPFVFISYSHEDKEEVYEIIRKLQAKGYRVWYDESIPSGAAWSEMLIEKTDECACFISFITEDYLKSNYCRNEINYAISEKEENIAVVFLKEFEEERYKKLAKFMFGYRQGIFKYIEDEETFYERLFETKGMDKCLEEISSEEYYDPESWKVIEEVFREEKLQEEPKYFGRTEDIECAEEELDPDNPDDWAFMEEYEEFEDFDDILNYEFYTFPEIEGVEPDVALPKPNPVSIGWGSTEQVIQWCGEMAEVSVRYGEVWKQDIEECVAYMKLARYHNKNLPAGHRFRVMSTFVDRNSAFNVVNIEYWYDKHLAPLFDEGDVRRIFYDNWSFTDGIEYSVLVSINSEDMHLGYYLEKDSKTE